MIGFAVLFGLLAVFLAQTWLNNQDAAHMRSLEAQRKAPAPERSIVVAARPLRFGEQLTASALRELPWPQEALPAGAFGKIADLIAAKRVVLTPMEPNEAVLASKVTGPGQRATLSAVLDPGMTAVTVRVNDVEGVAGFVLPGDRVDVMLTRQARRIRPPPMSSSRTHRCWRSISLPTRKPTSPPSSRRSRSKSKRPTARESRSPPRSARYRCCCARPATSPTRILAW